MLYVDFFNILNNIEMLNRSGTNKSYIENRNGTKKLNDKKTDCSETIHLK